MSSSSSLSEEEEEEEEIIKELPSRSTRGTRLNKLIGEEEEADQAFWGQEAWNLDDDDNEYSEESEEEDVIDADFDLEEDPDEEVHDGDGVEKRKRVKHTVPKSIYKEPYTKPSSAAAPRKRSVIKREKMKFPAEYYRRTLRASTAMKSSVFAANYRKRAQEMAQDDKKIKVVKRFTQEELLAEAIQTEVENTRSLNRLEQLEEERRIVQDMPKTPYSGNFIRYHSKLGHMKTITFCTEEDDVRLFYQRKGTRRKH